MSYKTYGRHIRILNGDEEPAAVTEFEDDIRAAWAAIPTSSSSPAARWALLRSHLGPLVRYEIRLYNVDDDPEEALRIIREQFGERRPYPDIPAPRTPAPAVTVTSPQQSPPPTQLDAIMEMMGEIRKTMAEHEDRLAYLQEPCEEEPYCYGDEEPYGEPRLTPSSEASTMTTNEVDQTCHCHLAQLAKEQAQRILELEEQVWSLNAVVHRLKNPTPAPAPEATPVAEPEEETHQPGREINICPSRRIATLKTENCRLEAKVGNLLVSLARCERAIPPLMPPGWRQSHRNKPSFPHKPRKPATNQPRAHVPHLFSKSPSVPAEPRRRHQPPHWRPGQQPQNWQPGQPRQHLQPGQPRGQHWRPGQPRGRHWQPGQPRGRRWQPGQPRHHWQPGQPRHHWQPGQPRQHWQPGQPGGRHWQPGQPQHWRPGQPQHWRPGQPQHWQPGQFQHWQPGQPQEGPQHWCPGQ